MFHSYVEQNNRKFCTFTQLHMTTFNVSESNRWSAVFYEYIDCYIRLKVTIAKQINRNILWTLFSILKCTDDVKKIYFLR